MSGSVPRSSIALAAVIATISVAGPRASAQTPQTEWQLPAAPPAAVADTTPARSCDSLTGSALPHGAVVREARVVPGDAGGWCRIALDVAPSPTSRVIKVWVALPIKWNGRFLGLGGGGWVPGFPIALRLGAPLGFATAITNAGRPYDVSIPPDELERLVGRNDFLLDAEGGLDWRALQDFAYRGVHEMTVLGKAVTAAFYGRPPRYSYFSGCSTGGRQGQSEVQRYPDDYDGVLSGAPAINWAHFAMADSWALTVTHELGPVPQCKYDAANRAAIAACDADDGVRDGLVSRVGSCRFDPRSLIGTRTDCGVIDEHDAEVIGRIWDGPHRRDGQPLWNGTDRAALIHAPPPLDVATARPGPFSARSSRPVIPSIAGFEDEFDEFVERYGAVMDTSDPDLSGFAHGGGKTILWHGIADDVIPAAGTVRYVESVRGTLGAAKTDEFLRFYLAPGVGHCGGGNGPPPVALLGPLMDWVEHGRSPREVRGEQRDAAGNVVRSRPLCPYPQRVRYRGHGSIDAAGSFQCRSP
jgi:feruloyl esterase